MSGKRLVWVGEGLRGWTQIRVPTPPPAAQVSPLPPPRPQQVRLAK